MREERSECGLRCGWTSTCCWEAGGEANCFVNDLTLGMGGLRRTGSLCGSSGLSGSGMGLGSRTCAVSVFVPGELTKSVVSMTAGGSGLRLGSRLPGPEGSTSSSIFKTARGSLTLPSAAPSTATSSSLS